LLKTRFNPTARALMDPRVPTVAAVNGVEAGAGVSLALTCDLGVASPTASFVQAFSKIGLIPNAGGSWLTVQRLGLARALGLALLGDRLSAPQAREWGMIGDVADDSLAAALALAERLAAMPTQALVATRAVVRRAAAPFRNPAAGRMRVAVGVGPHARLCGRGDRLPAKTPAAVPRRMSVAAAADCARATTGAP